MSVRNVKTARTLTLWAVLLGPPSPAAEAAAPPARPAASLAAFIVAHPDDWQLFMGDVAVATVTAGGPVVFVYLTAGGADRPPAYWQAREAGSAASAGAAAGRNGAEPSESSESSESPESSESRRSDCREVMVLAHRIHRCADRNTVSYHLRLPDGAYDGRGFAATRFQSLDKLGRDEGNGSDGIEAVDASARYTDWADLLRTVDSLLADELQRASAGALEIHSHDPDAAGNPGDHSDHRSTARLAVEIAARRQLAITGYAGYAIARRPVNLDARAVAAKTLVFMSYDRQRLFANAQWSAYAEEPAAYSSWLFRTYGRRIAGTTSSIPPCIPNCTP